jgi:hypothetical protein
MSDTPVRTFYYHADANAIGGYITRPFQGFVPSHTSVSLPMVGGFIQKQRAGRKWKNIVSYTSEATHVSGSRKDEENGGPWTTQVSTTIEGLNILDVITADRIVAQLSVAHPDNGGEPVISVVGSQFINLRISGTPIEPVIKYDFFTDHDGSAEADPKKRYPKRPWLEQEKFLEKVQAQKADAKDNYAKKYEKSPIPEWISHHFHGLDSGLKGRDFVVCSLIDQLPEIPNFPGTICGHGIYVPGFGKVYFGELIVTNHQFRLSMVRAQLGSPVGGAVTAATASSNGKPVPPGGL